MSRVALILLGLLALPQTAEPGAPLRPDTDASRPAAGKRDAFYCQPPDLIAVYNISSGFNAEIADDIPAEYAGQVIRQVTVWIDGSHLPHEIHLTKRAPRTVRFAE